MPTKHQKFKIPIDSRYTLEAKEAIAQDVIDFIVKRTKDRLDKNGVEMTGYSKEYAKSVTGQAAGKQAGQAANLFLSGDMLAALGEHLKIKDTYIEIGYDKNSDENGKADGNIRGTYGTNRASKKRARDFLGINDVELGSILVNYHVEEKGKDEEETKESILISKFAAEKAKELVEKTSKKLEKNIAALVEKYGYGDGKK